MEKARKKKEAHDQRMIEQRLEREAKREKLKKALAVSRQPQKRSKVTVETKKRHDDIDFKLEINNIRKELDL